MKQRITILLMACAAITPSVPPAARAQVGISASIQINAPTDFYQPLTPYGTWVDVGTYGRCWHPREVEAGWQPYTVGSWEWTDAGWYWNSDEPWSWACYHYGSWYNDSRVGWVWIPGTDWAPAWVTWRSSDAYIGWAPCGPGLSVLAPSFFTFCDIHHFHDHFQRHDLIVNNTTIINRTTVIKNFQRQSVDFDGHQRTIYANKGPGVDSIQRATGAKFTPRPVRDVIRQSPHPDNIQHNGDQHRDINQTQHDQRPTQEQHPTPAPTGRDEQRNYQQQQQQNNQQQHEIQRQQPPLTPVQPQQPEQHVQPAPKPVVPQSRPDVIPPTGKDQPRIYNEPAKPAQPFEPREEVPVQPQHPVTPQHPATPPERPLPPTGRDGAPPTEHHEAVPPAQAPALKPVAPPAPPANGHEHDGKDHNP